MNLGQLISKLINNEFELGTVFESLETGRKLKYELYTGVNPEIPSEILTDEEALINMNTNAIVELTVTIVSFKILGAE